MISVAVEKYTIQVHQGELPQSHVKYKSNAKLYDLIEPSDEGEYSFIGIGEGLAWPHLCVVLRYPDAAWLFSPGVLLVPETGIVFIGGGEHALAYDLHTPRRLWDEHAHDFWRWQRHGDVVLMSAELEFSAWTISGEKLWSADVEPWWEYKVENGEVILDVMDVRSTFPLLQGPVRRVRE